MAICMARTIKEERLRWVRPMVQEGVKLRDAAKLCPYGQRTLERWLAAYRRGGERGLAPHSTRPKTHPGETPIALKERVIALRRETKLCALKLKWRLAKQGLQLHERTIGKILKHEQLTRRYRVKRVKYKYLTAVRQPGELLELDVKYVPGPIQNRQYYQYTAIDCASRWRYLAIYGEQDNPHALRFLEEVVRRFPYPIQAIKTDNHATFTNRYTGTTQRSDRTVKAVHALDRFCAARGITHYLIDPGKPAQNGAVERSHRSDQESFYDRQTFHSLPDLQQKLLQWNAYYNDLEHCGLGGKTPNEMLALFHTPNPPYVRT